MRQTWFETARKNLKDGERLLFYELCFNYEFYGEEPAAGEVISAGVMIMFDMVKESLAADAEKAQRIAMRNRRNGLQGGRPKEESGVGAESSTESTPKSQNPEKPRETQKNPNDNLGYFGLPLHNNIQIQKHNNNTTSLSADFAEKEKFLVGIVFFGNGTPDVLREVEKFYNYYEARGWQVANGVPVRDKVALAKVWKIENADERFVVARVNYIDFITYLNCTELELLHNFVRMEEDADEHRVVLTFRKKSSIEIIEKRYLRAVVEWFKSREVATGAKWTLDYKLIRSSQKELKFQS